MGQQLPTNVVFTSKFKTEAIRQSENSTKTSPLVDRGKNVATVAAESVAEEEKVTQKEMLLNLCCDPCRQKTAKKKLGKS